MLIALSLLGDFKANETYRMRASNAAEDLLAEVSAFPVERREQLTRIAFVFSFHESSWLANPPGHNDQGNACGTMQTWMPWIEIPGTTCKTVREDRRLGFRIGLQRINNLWTKCGTLTASLTAFATTGQCASWTLPLVAHRCKEAGLTSTCNLKG